MDSLAGELATMDIGDLFTLIGGKRFSGHLVLENGSVTKNVFFFDGMVTLCTSNQPRDSFGQMLMQFDRISEAELKEAYQAAESEKTLLGVQLVRLGHMSHEDVCQNLIARMRETILDATQWQNGNFRFARGVIPPDIPAIDVNFDANSLLQEIEFRKTVWETMRQVFSSERLTLIPHEERIVRGLQPGSLDSRIFEMIRQGACLSEIADRLFRSPFFFYQKLYALYRQGAVEIGPERPPDRPLFVGKSMDDAGQMLSMAQGFFQSGNFGQAEMIVSQILETKQSPEVLQLKNRIETAHLELLRERFLEPNPTPRLSKDFSGIDSAGLSAQEKYLLRRIDGSKTVRMLLRITPMREFDALKCLERFIDAGYIEMPIAIP